MAADCSGGSVARLRSSRERRRGPGTYTAAGDIVTFTLGVHSYPAFGTFTGDFILGHLPPRR